MKKYMIKGVECVRVDGRAVERIPGISGNCKVCPAWKPRNSNYYCGGLCKINGEYSSGGFVPFEQAIVWRLEGKLEQKDFCDGDL